MRLTKKINEKYTVINKYYWCNDVDEDKITEKLGQLEDIEKELGIDLLTLFKAGKELAYYDDELGLVQGYFSQKFCLDIWQNNNIEHKAYIVIGDKILFLKDYGKTWSLDKSDLEKKDD